MSSANADDVLLENAARPLAKLHLKHYRERSALQRSIEKATASLARPICVLVLLLLVAAWFALHVYQIIVRDARVNPDPTWLAIALEFCTLLMTALILAGQQKEEELSNERQEMALHLLSIVDRKISAQFAIRPTDLQQAKDQLDRVHEQEFDASN